MRFIRKIFKPSKSVLAFLVGSCLLTMLCAPALAEMDVYINGQKADEIFSKQEGSFQVMDGEEFAKMIGVTYDAPYDEIKGGDFELITKKASTDNQATLKERSRRDYIAEEWYGEVRSYITPVSPPGSCPYRLYARWISYLAGDFDLWILRVDSSGTVYYCNSSFNWVTTITSIYGYYSQDETMDIYTNINLPWGISTGTFYVGMDDVRNGVFDGTIAYVTIVN